jgi:hypothetical protein
MPTPYAGTPSNATPQRYAAIIAASNTTPIQITTAAPHGFSTGDIVSILGLTGCTAANNRLTQRWTITVTGAQTFTLNCSQGNGSYAYSSGSYTYACDLSPPTTSTNTGRDTVLQFNVPIQDAADRSSWLFQQVPSYYLVGKKIATPALPSFSFGSSGWAEPVAQFLDATHAWQPGDVLDVSCSGDYQYCTGTEGPGANHVILRLAWWDDVDGNIDANQPMPGGTQNFLPGNASAVVLYDQGFHLRSAIVNEHNGWQATISAWSGGVQLVSGLSGMTAGAVGNWLRVAGAATPGNNGTFLISAYESATAVYVLNPTGTASDANSGSIAWGLYNTQVNMTLQASGYEGDTLVGVGTDTLQITVDHYRSTVDPLLVSLQ